MNKGYLSQVIKLVPARPFPSAHVLVRFFSSFSLFFLWLSADPWLLPCFQLAGPSSFALLAESMMGASSFSWEEGCLLPPLGQILRLLLKYPPGLGLLLLYPLPVPLLCFCLQLLLACSADNDPKKKKKALFSSCWMEVGSEYRWIANSQFSSAPMK